ncbi:hypothetical protein SEUCBS139899_003523 [Sporothrix eucalyptigena]|uniref:NAD(P)-binding domain-containing protein n=1 Tax=Sporothrix eucalyptigena TaxID=1812306 RepID=A0ABP0APR0_9PEZI
MAPNIFVTGATGFIGGDAFYALYDSHPDYDYTLLVRSQDRADVVTKAYPDAKNIHFVIGDLDSSDVISAAAAAADVVLHTGNSADDLPSAKAIVAGLTKSHTANNPGIYIHISGTGLLTWYDIKNKRFGQPPLPDQTYNDYDGVQTLVSGLPDDAPHRDVDIVVQSAAAAHPDILRTAIVGPPTIYGHGRGPGNQRSVQVPNLAKYLLKKGYAPIVEGGGETIWDNVHVHDVSSLLVRLVEAGLDPAKRDNVGGNQAPGGIFGTHAYYFPIASTHKWSDVAKQLADSAVKQGILPSATTKVEPYSVITSKDAPGSPGSNQTWTANSHGEPVRGGKLLGWKPTGPSLEATIPGDLADEAKYLGISAK